MRVQAVLGPKKQEKKRRVGFLNVRGKEVDGEKKESLSC